MNPTPPANSSDAPAQIPTCAVCGKPARHNVPRLGASAGWVHAHDGSHLCAVPDADRKAQRITPECQPVFPCEVSADSWKTWFTAKSKGHLKLSFRDATHWRPLQPNAPQEVPMQTIAEAANTPEKAERLVKLFHAAKSGRRGPKAQIVADSPSLSIAEKTATKTKPIKPLDMRLRSGS